MKQIGEFFGIKIFVDRKQKKNSITFIDYPKTDIIANRRWIKSCDAVLELMKRKLE